MLLLSKLSLVSMLPSIHVINAGECFVNEAGALNLVMGVAVGFEVIAVLALVASNLELVKP